MKNWLNSQTRMFMMKALNREITHESVRNPSDLPRPLSYLSKRKPKAETSNSSYSKLLAAILKRKTETIASMFESKMSRKNRGESDLLNEDLYKIMLHAYGSLLEKPVLLAMKLASSETTETTKDNEPTRLDVLHCLASHFDDLVSSARKQGKPLPDLNEILKFGRDFDTAIPLHTFILGLPEHRKEEAAAILKGRKAANT